MSKPKVKLSGKDKPLLSSLEADLLRVKQMGNRLYSDLNFGQLRSWLDVYLIAGYSKGEIEYANEIQEKETTEAGQLQSNSSSSNNKIKERKYHNHLQATPTREELKHFIACLELKCHQQDWIRIYEREATKEPNDKTLQDIQTEIEQSITSIGEDRKTSR